MAAKTLTLTALLLLATTSLPAQKFKDEVDGAIKFLRANALASRALGDGSCRMTAQILTAMGHCHRLYSIHDGPVVRNPLKFLITRRQADGSFADEGDADPVLTTLWVTDAMRALAAEDYAAEITAGLKWLATKTTRTSAFAGVAWDDAQLEAAARRIARGPVMADGKPDLAATTEALVILARGQHAARLAAAQPATAWTKVQQRGMDFLMTQQENGRFFMLVPVGQTGKFMKRFNLGLTGMGIASLSTKPVDLRTPAEQKAIDEGLAHLVKSQVKEGPTEGAFGNESINYTTCAAVMALAKNPRPEFSAVMKLAQRFLIRLQSAEGKGYAPSDRDYGSIGYGGDERGDLSNTQFGVQAARETGLPADDDFFAKAIQFAQRTQNLPGSYKGQTRDSKTGQPVQMVSGTDGGSAYYPGNSPAGYIDLPDGSKIPRSYGSMTYALLKTYTLCGMSKDDPRVAAAVGWIGKNFTVDTNPGADPRMGEKAAYQGLYYYYMVMAQALQVAGIDKISVPDASTGAANSVDWRKALAEKLAKLQKQNGGWLNDKNGRWWEESDLVCTTYAMLALEHCK